MTTPDPTATDDAELRNAPAEGTGGLIQNAVEKASHLVASEIQLAKQEKDRRRAGRPALTWAQLLTGARA
jgi:hypothetical protein